MDTSNGLKEITVDKLVLEDLDNYVTLQHIGKHDVEKLGLTIGQTKLLTNAIEKIKCTTQDSRGTVLNTR